MDHFEILVVWTKGSRFQMSHWDDKLILEKISHLLLKILVFIYNLLDMMNKKQNSFKKEVDQIFSQFFLGDEFFQKLRQV